MKKTIRRVTLVSDGVLVEFGHGLQCYFPTSFLQEQVGKGSNQVFLDYDPSPKAAIFDSARLQPTFPVQALES